MSKDNPNPRTKKLIRAIGKFSKRGVRIIKADFDALFADILGETSVQSTAIELHREAFEAVQATLECKSDGDRAKELRELIAVASAMLSECNIEEEMTPREQADLRTQRRFAVVG